LFNDLEKALKIRNINQSARIYGDELCDYPLFCPSQETKDRFSTLKVFIYQVPSL
jgi:hypothetical protein